MTVNGKTLCSVIQSFPVLLILAQKGNKCLKTPFVYKPPTPTHSPEYYEAYDALIQSLLHGCKHQHYEHLPSYGYGKKWFDGHGSVASPCYDTPTISHEYPQYYPFHGHEYPSTPHYVYRNLESLNATSNPEYKYANHVTNVKRKYKVVIVKPRRGQMFQKLQGFFPRREDRRFNTFGPVQNFLQNPRGTLQALLNFGPNRGPQRRPEYGIINVPYYDDQNGNRPINLSPGQNYYNGINYSDRDYNNGKPVVFEPPVTNNPFEYDNNPNSDNNALPNEGFTTGRSNEFTLNIVEGAINTPGNDRPGIDNTPIIEGNNGIPNVPPPEVEENNGIPNVSPPEVEENNGIPNVPPPGVEENNGIPNIAPPEVEENNGIPNVSPPSVEENNGIPTTTPILETSQTTLAPLTPVPATATKNNFNFGSEGLFLEQCETVEGGTGSCIPVVQCEPYVKLLQQLKANPSAVQVLRKAQCGFEGRNPKVCCPRPGIPTSLPSEETPTEAPAVNTEAPRPSAKSLTDEGDYIEAFPEPPVCGVSNASFTRVVGGIDAKLGDFPWVTLLGYQGRLKQGVRWNCGGSLVSSKHVLTAAHCIHGHEDDLYLVRVGELDLARDNDGAAPVDVLIKTKIKHEGYNPKAFTNDIGLLLLQREIKFTPLIRPICIPVDAELRERSYVDYNPIIAGWGDTEFRGPKATHLQALQLPVVSNEQCADAYKQYKAQVIDERVLCAGYKNGGRDACQGDSGGPLMQPIWNSRKYTTHFYQIGVVSYGKRCAEAGFPGVYTRVTHFVPWLQEKMLGKA